MGFTINRGNSLCETSNKSAVVFTLNPGKFLYWSLLQQDTGGFEIPGSEMFALYIKDIIREKRMREKRGESSSLISTFGVRTGFISNSSFIANITF